MVSQRIRKLDAAGFTLIELIVVMAIIAIVVGISAPFFTSYYQAMKLRTAADEMATILNSARYQAIKQNTTVCVALNSPKVQYHVGGCGGPVWVGPGTDGTGAIRLQNTLEVSAATANVTFTNLGAATLGGTYTIRNPDDGHTLTVTVAGSGRITIP
jgi:prepilin-type N-terminal cleavage/methylation domain-containing protein